MAPSGLALHGLLRRCRIRRSGRGVREAGALGRRGMAAPRRRPRLEPLLAGGPDRRLELRPVGRRVAVAVGGSRGAARCPAGLRHRSLPLRTADDRRPAVRAHQPRPGGAARSGDRRAGLADRGAAGERQVDGGGREAVADAAVPDQTAGVRAPGRQRGRPDRLDPGTARRSAQDRREAGAGADVPAPDRPGRSRT